MPARGQPSGGGSEASRLLQEGLQLLAERAREVDAIVGHARDRARQHIAEAEERAQQIVAAAEESAQDITAEAERSRAEIQEQLAALRIEIAEARRDLAQLRTARAEPAPRGRGAASAAAASAAAAAALAARAAAAPPAPAAADAGTPDSGSSLLGKTDSAGSTRTGDASAAHPTPAVAVGSEAGGREQAGPEEADTGAHPHVEAVGPGAGPPWTAGADDLDTIRAQRMLGDASDVEGGPRWGRRSSIAPAQAKRVRSSRPRWLPPWVPFVLVLLAGVGIVTATVGGQAGAGQGSDSTSVIVVTFAPSTATPSADGSRLGIATATTIAASIAVAARAVGEPTLVGTPGRTPTPSAAAQPATRATLVPSPSPGLGATVAPAGQPGASAASRVPGISPIPLPGAVKPDAAVLGAYTAYSAYVVQPGDTLNKVADALGVSRDSIVSASHLTDPNLLQPGQVLTIPRDTGWLYRVQPSDTLQQISQRFGVGVDALVTANALPMPDVRPGDLLLIPSLAPPGPKQ